MVESFILVLILECQEEVSSFGDLRAWLGGWVQASRHTWQISNISCWELVYSGLTSLNSTPQVLSIYQHWRIIEGTDGGECHGHTLCLRVSYIWKIKAPDVLYSFDKILGNRTDSTVKPFLSLHWLRRLPREASTSGEWWDLSGRIARGFGASPSRSMGGFCIILGVRFVFWWFVVNVLFLFGIFLFVPIDVS